MDISIELVPRNQNYLADAISQIQQRLPTINTINIPDIRKVSLRSWQGCEVTHAQYPTSIPHLRAVDTHPDRPLSMLPAIRRLGLRKVLVVTGDTEDGAEPSTTSLALIKRLKQEAPELEIYAALDPYRQDVATEIAYAQQKIAAGAIGFFTQPFFDLRLAEIYAEQLTGIEIYWGVAPVLTQRSSRYWKRRNKAIFPRSFDQSMGWNRQLAKQILNFAKIRGDHVYFMPIRVDIVDYLGGIV